MNESNAEAIDELYRMPDGPHGINESFYWAVHGNWPAINAILKAHFARPEVEAPKERLARITIRNPHFRDRVIIEVCGRRETIEAGQHIDLALAEQDRSQPQSKRSSDG